MAEYIERKAANDWIVDMFYSEEDEGCKELVELFNKAIPAADVIQIVRCKNCRYQHACAFDAYDDFYCASGKRKGGGAK